MATSASYYLNAPSLGSATAVFSNDTLTTLAADGFYSNGVIVREQVSGVLLPQQTCPTCATPCGETINASGGQGIYLLDLDTGTTVGDVGAVIVRFDPYGVPDGIKATLGVNVYNKVTSPVDGLHQSSTSGNFTYVGQTSGDCGISGTTYPALTEFSYNGTAFVATGDTQSITVNAGDVSLGASAPGSTMMVIPKLTASPSIINFEVVGPCSGTAWQMSVDCPVLLTGFSSSVMAATSVAVCELTETVTYYNASLANTPGTVGLYDFVYADAYGSTPLTAGYYLAAGSITGSNDWFQVNSSGVVIALGVCAAPPEVSYNCVEGICTDPGDGSGFFNSLEQCQENCAAPTISLGSAQCRENNCNDNAACTVIYGVNTSNVPAGSYITVLTGTPSSSATVTISDSDPDNGKITYYEPSGSATPVYFTLQLRNSGGTIIATSDTSLTHQSFWPMLPLCTPILVTYNCVSGTCIDPGDGTGTYATLEACETACSTPVAYTIDNSATGTALEACGGSTTTTTVYALPGYTTPIVTMIFYDSSALTTPFIGSAGWRKLSIGGTNYAAQVDVNGELTDYITCPAPPEVSYNCVEGICTDPGDGTGTYSTLEACEEGCIPITYNCVSGTCIDPGDGTGTYATLEACETACSAPTSPTVTGVGGYMQPCVGGTIDDYMGASVSVDSPVDADSTFEVSVKYVLPGNSCGVGESTQSIYPIILSGGTSSTFDACTNGAYFPSGAVICSACVVSCDNPSVNLSTYSC